MVLICATVLVGVSLVGHAKSLNVGIDIGVFNSKQNAQDFFHGLPTGITSKIPVKDLWLDVYKSNKGDIEHHINISNVAPADAQNLCNLIASSSMRCVVASREPLFPAALVSAAPESDALTPIEDGIAPARGVRLQSLQSGDPANIDVFFEGYNQANSAPAPLGFEPYTQDFTLSSVSQDTPEANAAKAAYEAARNDFLSALQSAGDGLNAGQGSEAALQNLQALGQKAFEAAGSVYLSDYLEREFGKAEALSSEAGSGDAFIYHVKANLGRSAKETVGTIISKTLSGSAGDTATITDTLMLSGARSFIDAGVSAARRSDLYALRNMELEYNLNNFENSYLSALLTQPVYQSQGLRHNVFLQGGGIVNEQSVDVGDDVARHTLNMGAAYRYLTVDEKYLLGGNIFFDHQWPYNHSRLGVGVDAKSKDLNLAANYYHPITGFKDSRTDELGQEYEEAALEGYDIELGYSPPAVAGLSIFGKGYQYFRETDDDLLGVELSAEYEVRNNFVVKGAVIEENGGRDGVEMSLQYRVPLYDTKRQNLALADIETAAGSESVRDKIFEKVRRENRIRVEERAKTDNSPTIITAQFNALSTGLPYDVGGTATGAGINLPFDTAITVPNGNFGIINFSNGAIANISASGGGDVILEFNDNILTVTATNGGFVQFTSGSGGISIVNVPGGTVNLLGTDIDVTDNGVTTTIQVRAGAIEVVPNVGVDVEGGNQADIVNLTIATGATTKLAGAALNTRQEAAFTNLDAMNPNPPVSSTAAPFVTKVPELISSPQFVGNNADIRLTFSKPVNVTGAPQITGFVDANARTFVYDMGASTPSQLVFRYVFIAADAGAASVTADAFDLNGGTIIGNTDGLTAITAFTSTVIPIVDTNAPILNSSTPADEGINFSPTGNIILNFNENVQANVGNIVITDTTDGSNTLIIPITDPQVVIAGAVVTINPTGFMDRNSIYDLTIGNNVIQDVLANPFPGIASGELNFTTENDMTGPTLTATSPVDNATGIARNSNLVFTFDEDVVLAGTINLVDTDDASGNISYTNASPEVTVSANTITINPAANLEYAENYELTYTAGAVQDVFTNNAAALLSGAANFQTVNLEAALALTLNITAPADNVDETNVQGSGITIDTAGTYVMAMDITIPVAPTGLLFECGGGGQGQYVGFNAGANVLRFRGGEGGQAPPDTDMANLDIPIGSITPGSYTLTFEYEFATEQIRAWLDETLLGTAVAAGGALESNRWSGGDNCAFVTTSTTSLTVGETAIGFNGPLLNPNVRYYKNQTLP